jgi:hypothetical protein
MEAIENASGAGGVLGEMRILVERTRFEEQRNQEK